ncbi:hypothetical protein SCHPADRAFT_608798 [Schizopora paradoxa]|uniref:Uncharacterized protein n=1 Tax=Schizopora paradoxa TaxID=27342 RepID=A0A0H2R9E0_9AGAM|nr:hypothetical protein SCHPADRAFT_608798 [Schizopora paradoxa]
MFITNLQEIIFTGVALRSSLTLPRYFTVTSQAWTLSEDRSLQSPQRQSSTTDGLTRILVSHLFKDVEFDLQWRH